MSEKISMSQYLKNLSNFEKSAELKGYSKKYDYLGDEIINQKQVFQEFWKNYKQVYNFNVSYDIIKTFFGKSFDGMVGRDFCMKLKSLPYNTIILNCSDCEKYNLLPFFYEEDDRSRRIFADCKENLILVSNFLYNNVLYLFIAPTDYEGNIKSNSFIFKIDMVKAVKKSLEKLVKQTASVNAYNTIMVGKTESDLVALRKRRHKKSILYSNISTYIIRHLLYLSKCNIIELPKEIKYIISENNETTFNIVTDNKEIKPIRERDFVIAHKIIDGVLYYHKSVTEPTGKTLCSHTRRGHQHRYWVGSGDKKRLVTKWVEPIIVNEGKNELSTVINNIN